MAYYYIYLYILEKSFCAKGQTPFAYVMISTTLRLLLIANSLSLVLKLACLITEKFKKYEEVTKVMSKKNIYSHSNLSSGNCILSLNEVRIKYDESWRQL